MSLGYQGMLEQMLTENTLDLTKYREALEIAEQEANSAKSIAVRLGNSRDTGMVTCPV